MSYLLRNKISVFFICIIVLFSVFQGLVKIYIPRILAWKEVVFFLILCSIFFYITVQGNFNYHKGFQLPYFLLICLPIVINIIRSINTMDLGRILWCIKPWYLYSLFIIAFGIYDNNEKYSILKKVINILILTSIVVFVVGIIEYFSNVNILYSKYNAYVPVTTLGGILRVFSTFVSNFSYGNFCATVSIFALLYFLENKKKLYLLVFLINIIGVYLSRSREAMLEAIIGLTVAIILYLFHKTENKRNYFLKCIIIILISIGLILIIFNSVLNTNISLLSSGSLEQRIGVVWKDAGGYVSNLTNLFFGAGLGTIGAAQARFESSYNFGDNLYLQLIINQGLIGLIGFLLFVILILYKIFKSIKFSDKKYLLIGVYCFILSSLCGAFFRSILDGFPFQLYFWLILSLTPIHKET